MGRNGNERYRKSYSFYRTVRRPMVEAEGVPCECKVMNLHDTTYSPVGLWQFQENLEDSSGHNYDLTLVAGFERYTEFFPGVRAIKLFQDNRYTYPAQGSLLQIAGDLTIEMLLSMDAYGASNLFVGYDSNGETEVTNTLYAFGFAANQFFFLSESGLGANAVYNSGRGILLGHVSHVCIRRRSNVLQLFVNGLPFGTSATLTAPTGGTSSQFWLGSNSGGFALTTPACAMASLKVVASALSDAQIKGEYNLTLGGVYGRLD